MRGAGRTNDPVSRVDVDIAVLIAASEDDILLEPQMAVPWERTGTAIVREIQLAARLGIPDK
jgi:hypothetical protein